jgi:hypothetical protein
MLTVKADNVTISNPDATAALDRVSTALERMSIVVNVPQQEAPVVNVTNTVEPTPVTIQNEVKPSEVKIVESKTAEVKSAKQPKTRKEKQKVIRNKDGQIDGSETTVTYEY